MALESDDYAKLDSNDPYSDFLFHILVRQRCLFIGGFSFTDPALSKVLEFYRSKAGMHTEVEPTKGLVGVKGRCSAAALPVSVPRSVGR